MTCGDEEGAVSLNKIGTILYFVGGVVLAVCTVLFVTIIILNNA